MEERNDWLTLMQGKVLYLQYLALCREEQIRPDPRVISLCGRYITARRTPAPTVMSAPNSNFLSSSSSFVSMSISVLNLDDLHISTGLLKILRTLFENHKEVLTHSSTPQPPPPWRNL